jgi:hypothetical protein
MSIFLKKENVLTVYSLVTNENILDLFCIIIEKSTP